MNDIISRDKFLEAIYLHTSSPWFGWYLTLNPISYYSLDKIFRETSAVYRGFAQFGKTFELQLIAKNANDFDDYFNRLVGLYLVVQQEHPHANVSLRKLKIAINRLADYCGSNCYLAKDQQTGFYRHVEGAYPAQWSKCGIFGWLNKREQRWVKSLFKSFAMIAGIVVAIGVSIPLLTSGAVALPLAIFLAIAAIITNYLLFKGKIARLLNEVVLKNALFNHFPKALLPKILLGVLLVSCLAGAISHAILAYVSLTAILAGTFLATLLIAQPLAAMLAITVGMALASLFIVAVFDSLRGGLLLKTWNFIRNSYEQFLSSFDPFCQHPTFENFWKPIPHAIKLAIIALGLVLAPPIIILATVSLSDAILRATHHFFYNSWSLPTILSTGTLPARGLFNIDNFCLLVKSLAYNMKDLVHQFGKSIDYIRQEGVLETVHQVISSAVNFIKAIPSHLYRNPYYLTPLLNRARKLIDYCFIGLNAAANGFVAEHGAVLPAQLDPVNTATNAMASAAATKPTIDARYDSPGLGRSVFGFFWHRAHHRQEQHQASNNQQPQLLPSAG